MAGELIVVYNLLPEIAAKIEEVAGKVVRKAAFDIVAGAMAEAGSFRVTGFLTNSIYIETNGGENQRPYSMVQGPEGDQVLLPEVDKPADKTTAIVAVAANYGYFVEYGTSRMAAHPFLTPAVERVRPQFEKALDKIIAEMEVSAV